MPTLWKRYLRWLRGQGKKRNRLRDAQILGLVVALVTLDQATKHGLTTQDWAWHEQPVTWLITTSLIVTATSLLLLTDTFRWAGIFLVSGGIGNVLSELLYDRVANPFQTQAASTFVAFNTADVLIAVGMTLLPISAVRLFISIKKEQPA